MIHESQYGQSPNNFHVAKQAEELHVTLTYPPYEDEPAGEKCRYVVVNQESVRATDGLRVWFHFGRNQFIVEQESCKLTKVCDGLYEDGTIWTEVGAFDAWALSEPDMDKLIADADAEFAARDAS